MTTTNKTKMTISHHDEFICMLIEKRSNKHKTCSSSTILNRLLFQIQMRLNKMKRNETKRVIQNEAAPNDVGRAKMAH